MNYLDIYWRHEHPEYPHRLVSELDNARWETRKLEFYASGRVGYASVGGEVGGTRLGIEPLPPLSEINAQSEFEGKEIEAAEFHRLWAQHAGHAI